jgi:hypothetical protein
LAIRQGAHVRFVKTSRILADLAGGHADRTWQKRIRELVRPDMLILDDFAMRQLSAAQADDLYELVSERQGRSLIITSNRATSDLYPLFPNPVIAESLLDRLINTSHQVIMSGPPRSTSLPRTATSPKRSGCASFARTGWPRCGRRRRGRGTLHRPAFPLHRRSLQMCRPTARCADRECRVPAEPIEQMGPAAVLFRAQCRARGGRYEGAWRRIGSRTVPQSAAPSRSPRAGTEPVRNCPAGKVEEAARKILGTW